MKWFACFLYATTLSATPVFAQNIPGSITSGMHSIIPISNIANIFQLPATAPTGAVLRQKALLKTNDIVYTDKKLPTPAIQDNKCTWILPDGILQYTSTETKNVEIMEWKQTSQNAPIVWEIEHPDTYAIWAPMDCLKIQWQEMLFAGRKYFYFYAPGIGPWQEGRAKDWRFALALPLDQLHKPLYIANRFVIQDILGWTSDGTLAFAKTKKTSKDLEAEPEWLLSPRVVSEVLSLTNSAYLNTSLWNVQVTQNAIQLQYSVDFQAGVIKRTEYKKIKERLEPVDEQVQSIAIDAKFDFYRKLLLLANTNTNPFNANTGNTFVKIQTNTPANMPKEWILELDNPVFQSWWQAIERYCIESKTIKRDAKEPLDEIKREKMINTPNSV